MFESLNSGGGHDGHEGHDDHDDEHEEHDEEHEKEELDKELKKTHPGYDGLSEHEKEELREHLKHEKHEEHEEKKKEEKEKAKKAKERAEWNKKEKAKHKALFMRGFGFAFKHTFALNRRLRRGKLENLSADDQKREKKFMESATKSKTSNAEHFYDKAHNKIEKFRAFKKKIGA